METWGNGGIAPPFFTSALDGGEWLASRVCRFTPEERAPGTHWIGGCVGPRVGLDAVEKRKILHCRESNPGCSSRSPLLYRLNYPHSLSKEDCQKFAKEIFISQKQLTLGTP
jgi:hypothetical protein